MENIAPAISPPGGLGENKPTNQAVLDWVREVEALTEPQNIFWCDGSEAENEYLLGEACRQDVLIKLNQKKNPGCYLHRSNPNDVARVEQFTLICTPTKEEAGPTNHWAAPGATYRKLQRHAEGRDARAHDVRRATSWARRIPRWPRWVRNYRLNLCRPEYADHDQDGRAGRRPGSGKERMAEFNRGVHSLLDVNPERRWICHFPQDNTIISVGSGYGGNVLLSKKCLALRIASYLAKKQGWLAEHMLILGVESPEGKKHYVAAAFPSACGKTNFAMLIPPQHFAGWKITTIGDDIAWMQIGQDGRLYAVNPENGYFGVVPGTSYKSNSERHAGDRARHAFHECRPNE